MIKAAPLLPNFPLSLFFPFQSKCSSLAVRTHNIINITVLKQPQNNFLKPVKNFMAYTKKLSSKITDLKVEPNEFLFLCFVSFLF